MELTGQSFCCWNELEYSFLILLGVKSVAALKCCCYDIARITPDYEFRKRNQPRAPANTGHWWLDTWHRRARWVQQQVWSWSPLYNLATTKAFLSEVLEISMPSSFTESERVCFQLLITELLLRYCNQNEKNGSSWWGNEANLELLYRTALYLSALNSFSSNPLHVVNFVSTMKRL